MRNVFVALVVALGVLVAPKVEAQSVLPRAGWVANASSSNGGDVPSHVLDGNSGTRWTTGGNQTPGEWLSIDMQSVKTFTQVTMDVAGNTSDYARAYELYVSNDGQTWGTPVASGTGATGIITIVFPSQTSRFIGIVQTGTSSANWWSVAELNVYAGTVPTTPLTPSGWTATATVHGSSDVAANAIDGNLATRFSTDAVQVSSGQSFQLDMVAPQLITALKMDSGSNSTDYARGYQVFASNSTSSWGSAIATGAPTSSPVVVYFAQTTARYVKIVQTGSASNWWSIAELTMYTVGSSVPLASVLPRLGWSASASASGSGNGPANALDDNGGTRWSTGVNQANGQSFTLDMLAPRSFTQVTLDTGSSNTGDYPRGYQLFVSSDGSSWGSAVATGAGSGQVTTISFSSQSARYIKVVQTGMSSTNAWSIAELNVYGVPPATLVREGWAASAVLDSGDAQLGIDGRAETQWSTETAQVNGQTYQVDMKVAQSFNEITLDVNCNPADYPRGYQVFASNSTSNWGTAIASGTGVSSMIAIAFAPQSARYLKVVQTATASNYWGLAELNVLNTNPSMCSAPCVAQDACHDVGTCNPSTGVCSNPPKTNGTTCNDGNACTQTDSCQAGVCTGGNPVTCTASDQCHAVGTCNTSSGVCSNPAAANGTGCSDGNACMQADTCQAGVCTAGTAVTCTASDQCHSAGTCDPASGVCSNPAKANGTACSDGNACTQTDACQAGVCTAGTAVTCAASDQCHAAGVCDPASGLCTNPAVANGTSCNDGNACTQTDSCEAGTCMGSSPVTCAASDQCHATGACNPATGACSNPLAANGTACSDGNACTQTDSCQAGVCAGGNPVTCAASDQCHAIGTCNPSSGVCSNPAKADGTTCSDGNACTQTDTCQSGVCAGSNPVTCAASDQCHAIGTCNPSSGVCSNPAKADGTACSDGNACTQSDACQAGACVGSNSVTCAASDQCHSAGTCDPASGTCSNPAKANGTACSDGNACTKTDTCVSGTCTGGNPVSCTASDQCHSAGTCDPASGACSNPAKTDGTSCSDGNACTQTDTCVAGTCTGANPVTCAAGDQCHAAGTCNPANGTCSNPTKADGTACSDGNACTQVDTCVAGACTGASAIICVALDQCHLGGVCNPATGACSNPAKSDGSTCNDGNPATQSDSCQAGICTGVAGPPCEGEDECDDGNPCTTDDHCFNGVCTGEATTCSPSTGECASYCDPATGACTTHPAADGSACDDGSSCTTGDVCTAGVCAGAGVCTGQFSVSVPSAWSAFFEPSLPLVTTADHSVVHAGDAVALTVSVTFDGIKISTSGDVDLVNNSPSPFVVPGYSVSLEYLSPTSNDWVALEHFEFDGAGQPLPPTTPGTVNFGGDLSLAGTTVSTGHTEDWFMDSTIFVPASALAILNDPAQASALREAFRLDEAPGLPSGAEVLTPINFPIGSTLVVSNLTPIVHFDGSTSTTTPMTPSVASVSLSSSQTFTGVGQVPALLTPSQANALAGYLTYLQTLAQETFTTQAFVFSTGSGFGSGAFSQAANLLIPMSVPMVVSTIISGPTTLPSGYTATYDVTLANPGNEVATHIALQPSAGGSATFSAPPTLGVGDTEPATLIYQSRAGVDLGNGGTSALVTWQDAAGNVYGPFAGSGWHTFFSPALPLGSLSLVGQPTHPVPVDAEQDFTVTALDPVGHPVVGVNVQLTVTGSNPQVLSAVTDASGVAAFSYNGHLPGGDTVVASATITTAPTQSSSATVFWSAPYGTPCVGTDVPLDVVVVIDTSSSMEGAPIEDAKAATLAFLNTMDLSRDQLGVVSFGGISTLNAGLTSDFAAASAGIASVEPGGNGFINPTNIGAGLNAALDELASSRARSTATPMIIFVSDGGNSFGDPEPALARLKASGIRTVAFGLAEADTIMLNRIASSKNDYYYAPTPDELSWLYSALGLNICRDQVPLVHAGGDQGAYGVTLPHTLTLQGEVHGDGPAGDPRLTSEWSVVSGPGTVTFVDASSPVTTALFTIPGTYVLQLEANDGTYTGTARATVTVDTEPSLAGASLATSLGTPSPLTVGASESLILTLTDASSQPIPNFPIQVTVTGPNAGASTLTTNASGVATLTYTSQVVGTDVLSAVALGITQLAAPPVSVSWTAAGSEQVVTQGWIGGPTHQSTVTGSTPITIGSGITLTSGTVTYWPLSAPDQIHTLATGVSGDPGATIATLDTTVLANGPWIVKLDGMDSAGASQVSEVSVTVSGDYKPGRVVVEETEFTIPLTGMPLTVGRRYDSLERDNVGDFGHGWSLTLGSPRLEVDPAHDVTITMPDGRRVTFYFQATSISNSVAFSYLLQPGYVPEAGTFGSLTTDGCDVMIVANGDDLVCFLDGSLDYAPTTYKYTDPYGRVFTMGASGELKSIEDKQQNVLTFTPNGISGTGGVTMAITRDSAGRITEILTPALGAGNNKLGYFYAYDAAGDLSTVTLATGGLLNYTYDADHFLLTTKDPLGNLARTSTYDTSGRLATDTDALGNVTGYAYDLAARKTTITNPDTGTVQQTFDDRGLLLTEVDPLGRTTQHTYDVNRNELTRTNALNEVSTFAYDSNGNQTSMSNGRGETTHITYNAFSQPLTSTDPSGHTTTIVYDDVGIPTQFSDETGTLATFTSSEHGLPLTVTDAAGNTAYLTYDPSGDLTSRTDRLSRLTQYTYDGIGRRTQAFDPRGGETDYFYDGEGNLVKSFDALGAVHGWRRDSDENINFESMDNNFFPYQRGTQHFFDADNHLTKDVYFDGTTILYTRDFRGNKLTETDESGRVTTYQYDKAGQLVKTTFADGTFTSRGYDDLGRLATATDERGNATTYEYETGCGCADRVTKVTDALGRATTTAYDAVGRRSSVTDAAGHTTGYVYDPRGHLIETDYADGTKETNTYDVLARRTAHTDQMGAVTQYGYDAEGQLTSVTDALSNVTQYAYDLSGNLASVTDANNHVTSYASDLLNRKSSRTVPLGQTETFGYDIVGNEVSHVDFRGKTSTYNFDHRDRLLTKVPDPTLGEPTVTLTYNPTGTRANMVDASGTTTYGYDARDRLLTKATSAGTLTYTYDPVGNVATTLSSNSNGTSVAYAWDVANQLISVTDHRAGGATTAAYTATGRPSALTQPNGAGAAYAYDTRDRATSLSWQRGTNPAFGSWSYGFNGRGQRTNVTDATGRQVVYGYDADSRLASETITNDPRGAATNGELSYSLDPTGNRLTRTSTLTVLGGQTFTYDADDQLATEGYDANGNTTSSEGHTYGYDFENRLVSKDSGAVSIVYDGDGNRVMKTVGGAATKYLVDDLNPTGYLQVLEEVSSGAVQTEYTYGTMLVSQMQQPGSSARIRYYGYDAHGNVTFLTDATGVLTDSYDYDAWGNVIASTGSTPNTRLYSGEELDPDLGMVNLRARYYRPGAGRFLTLDPLSGSISRPLSLNRYVYGEADPITFVDPNGMAALAEYGVNIGALVRTSAAILFTGYVTGCYFTYGVSAFNLIENTDVVPPIWQWCVRKKKWQPRQGPEPGPQPIPLPRTKPHECTDARYEELKKQVQNSCPGVDKVKGFKTVCKDGMACEDLLAKWAFNTSCAQARAQMTFECFPSTGDATHDAEDTISQKQADDCLEILRRTENCFGKN